MSTKLGDGVVMAEVVESRPARSALVPILLVLGIVGAIGAFFLATAVLLVAVAAITVRPQPISPEEDQPGIVNVTDQTFEAEVMNADLAGPILVDFHADWCGPCQSQGKILKRFAAEHSDVKIAKVDVDQNPALASRYNVRSIPTLLVVKHGEVTDKYVGLANEAKLEKMLKR